MASLNHNTPPLWLFSFPKCIRDLACHALLHLQTPREDFNQTSNLAEPDNLALRNIRHVYLAKKRQHVVLAERKHLYIFHDDHLVVVHIKERAAQDFAGVFLITLRQKCQGFFYTLWRRKQSIALRVFSNATQNLAIQLLSAGLFEVARLYKSLQH